MIMEFLKPTLCSYLFKRLSNLKIERQRYKERENKSHWLAHTSIACNGQWGEG